MKFTANRRKLLSSVKQSVMALAEESGHNMMSQIVILSAAKTKLKIAAASPSVWIKTHVSGSDDYQNETDGECGVSHKFLIKVLAASSSEHVSLNLGSDGVLDIEDEEGSTSLKVFPSDNFPPDPKTPKSELVSFQGSEIVQALRCVDSASQDIKADYRKILSGVFIDKNDDGELVFVATDSYRLASFPVPGSFDNKDISSGSVMPSEMVKIVISLADEDVIQLATTDDYCYAVAGETLVRSVWEDGDYPKYKNILDKEDGGNKTKISVKNVAGLKNALNRATVVSATTDAPVDMKTSDGNAIHLALKSDYGDTEYSVFCEFSEKDGDDVVSFNQKYLKDAVAYASTGNELDISWSSRKAPVLFEDPNVDGHFHIVMPTMR